MKPRYWDETWVRKRRALLEQGHTIVDLRDRYPLTLQQIANELGLAVSRVCTIYARMKRYGHPFPVRTP